MLVDQKAIRRPIDIGLIGTDYFYDRYLAIKAADRYEDGHDHGHQWAIRRSIDIGLVGDAGSAADLEVVSQIFPG